MPWEVLASAEVGLLAELEHITGGAVHLYGQYCPVARAAELLADRWTVLIIRELLADITHFNDLERGLPGISRTLLAERLRRLVDAGVVERRTASRGLRIDYRVTAAGRELQQLIDLLGTWGARWAFGDPQPSELDPGILMWWMRRRVCLNRMPRPRIVIEFEFWGVPSKKHFWFVIESSAGASICLQHPGFDVDVIVAADIAAFYRVWLGHMPFAEAVRRGDLHLDGMPADIRSFQSWFAWSPMEATVRAALPTAIQRQTDRPNKRFSG
jgi:DNA-binding HxlR family transcriptional regulator